MPRQNDIDVEKIKRDPTAYCNGKQAGHYEANKQFERRHLERRITEVRGRDAYEGKPSESASKEGT